MDPYFFRLLGEIRPRLARVFGTTNPFTIAISGTGSAGMEASVANFVAPGFTFAVFVNGFFGERIAEIGRRQGAHVVRLEKPWGETFGDDEAAAFIRREKPHVVAYVQAETSTGVFQDGKAICAAAGDIDALVIADCVTSLGGMPVQVDETGIDIAYSCSQKGLGCPPGLAPLTVSPRALSRLKQRTEPMQSWYLDLLQLEEYFDPPHKYHHTAPISMFYALREALAVVEDEGLENRWERHRRNHLAFVAGLESLGLSMLVPEGKRLWTLHTPRIPEGIQEANVRKRLLEDHGIEVLGGFGPLAGKVLRIGLMGAGSTREHVLLLLGALESSLRAEGHSPKGSAREAAEHAFTALV
jgi:alanine-glyoxylate transaminase/serine-glyoxylate transaminase/serine-pyruvate transaminase